MLKSISSLGWNGFYEFEPELYTVQPRILNQRFRICQFPIDLKSTADRYSSVSITQRSRVFATKSNFPFPISLQPNDIFDTLNLDYLM